MRRFTHASGGHEEDALVFPDGMRELVHPRRGGRLVPTLDTDPKHAWRLVDEFRDEIIEVLERPGGNCPPGQARAYLDDRAGSPWDAAVVATVVWWLLRHQKKPRGREVTSFVDAWAHEHGLDFTARAVMAQQPMFLNRDKALDHHDDRTPRRDRESLQPRFLAGRLRAHLAVANEEDHAAAVEALGECRRTDHDLLTTAFLVPSRADWVAAAVRSAPGAPLVLEALGDAAHLDGLDFNTHLLFDAATMPATMVDGIGPDVAPFLAATYDRLDNTYADGAKRLLAVLAVIPTDEAFDLLLRRINKLWVRSFVHDAMNRFPVRAARKLAAAPSSPIVADLLRAHVRAHAGLLAEADLPDSTRARLAQFPAPVAEADPDTLPALLVDPPWAGKRVATKPPTVTGLVITATASVAWLPGERERFLATTDWAGPWESMRSPAEDMARFLDGKLGSYEGRFAATAPDELVRPGLADWRPRSSWHLNGLAHTIVARHELAALPALLHVATHGGADMVAEAFLPFATAELTALMADWLVRLRTLRPFATTWLHRHQDVAARFLVPAALGKPGKDRTAAETALRLLDPAAVTSAAAEYGEKAEAGIAALLATDPLDVLPARVPRLPDWVDLPALPQLLLRDGGAALPDPAVAHVVTMLAMSKPDNVYAGVAVVRDLCTPESLAEFAWGLFVAWQTAGLPSHDGWALHTLAWFGDDETVRRLTPLIRTWPGEGGHARAVAGLDVLAAIGTDVALMHLHGVAQKVKFAGLRKKAQEKIAQVAAELALSPDQLADRLVPDLGLDADGSMALDYGPRRFVVGFDERLAPYVIDESGARRKDLPKPGARDDQELAPAAHKRFAALKKDVRTLAADQVRRLERAMVTGRRWTATEFTDLLAGHPLLRHVVRRLVWAHLDGERAALTFRVAEDRTLAGITDDTVTLPDAATIGVAHPLHLGDDLAAWVEIFADYEILQPFPQLGRPVHALTDEERTATGLPLFEDVTVPTGKVLGLTNRGWQRGEPQDGGVEPWILRPVPDGRAVVARLDPGIAVGVVDLFPEQKIEHLWLSGTGRGDWSPRHQRPFGELDPVTASEVLTDLTELTGTAR